MGIPRFDARRGYKRCSVPGLGVSWSEGWPPSALADFWRDRAGRLVVRFSSLGYVYHFEAMLGSGEGIPDTKLQAFQEYVEEVLADWAHDGVDNAPDGLD